MVRLENDTAQRLLALLAVVPDGEEKTQISTQLRDQINNPRFPGDMVDRIAGWLKRPNARGLLAGEVLITMRRALLSPRENAELETQLRRGCHCAVCGVRIVTKEVATIYNGEMTCARCSMPNMIRCACGEHKDMDIKAKIARVMRDCKTCKDKATAVEGGVAVVAHVPEAFPEPAQEGGLLGDPVFRNIREGGARGRGFAIPQQLRQDMNRAARREAERVQREGGEARQPLNIIQAEMEDRLRQLRAEPMRILPMPEPVPQPAVARQWLDNNVLLDVDNLFDDRPGGEGA